MPVQFVLLAPSGGLQSVGAQLVELDLSDNALGPIGGEGLKPLLASPTCWTLQILRSERQARYEPIIRSP